MGIGKGGSPTTTTNTQNQNIGYTPAGLSQFQNIYNRANAASQIPYQQYTGELVAPTNAEQQQGIYNIGSAYNNFDTGAVQPFMGAAQTGLSQAQNTVQGISPLTSGQIQNYMNPYQSQVINALTQNINETNAQQLQQVRGNAAAQHALGGDREAVAESELARQQNLGNTPAIANALAGGYNQALQTAGQQYQQLPLQQAQQYAGLAGQEAGLGGQTMQNQLQALQAGLQAGEAKYNMGTGLQQTQQAQDTANYQQYLQQLAYPYQQAQFLANIGIPAAGGMGGQQYQYGLANQVMTPPGISIPQGIAGLGLIGGGIFGSLNDRPPSGGQQATAEGGRIIHKAPGGSVNVDNPYATEPWNVRAVDITKGDVGTPLQTPQSQIHPVPGITISNPPQQSNPLGNISQNIAAAKGLGSIANGLGGLFGTGAGAGAADALAGGTDAGIALGGLGAGAAADVAGSAAAVGAGADLGWLADLGALAFAKRGGAIYPKRFADGGSPYDAAVADIENRGQQGGALMQAMFSRGINPYMNTAMQQRAASPPQSFAEGGDTDNDDQPWALESSWPTRGTNTAIPAWKSADPRGDMAALKNYGLAQSPEVSPNTTNEISLPRSRPALVAPSIASTDEEDGKLPASSTLDNADGSPTRVPITKSGNFDPENASYSDLMDPRNFKQYAPQRQSLLGLLKNPETRSDALMEMGLRILAAPPTSKSGLSEIASGALGTVADYNKFSSDSLSAQQKAQELAVRLKQQANNDEYNDERLKLEHQKLDALKDYRNNLVQSRFQKLLHGNLVPGNYQYPGPTGAVVGAYFNKEDGHIYDASTHEPLTGGRWAGTSAIDLGINKPPGNGANSAGDPIAAARAAIKAGASPEAVKQRLKENGIEPPADL